MYVDPARLAAQSEELSGQIAELSDRIRELAGGEEFNLSSPMQLSRVLFDKLGLPTAGLKRPSAAITPPTPRSSRTWPRTTRSCASSWSTASAPRSSRRTWIRWVRCARRTGACTPRTTRPSPPPGACRAPTPTCRTSHPLRAGPCRQEGVLGRGGLGLRRHRLLADRAAAAGAPLCRRASRRRLQRGGGLPCGDRRARVRRAGRGGHAAAAQPRQGRELRHRLRAAGLRSSRRPSTSPWARRAR